MTLCIVLVLAAAVVGAVNCELLDNCSITKSFVDIHNEKREQLAKGQVPGQPAASKMPLLVWDDELAEKARKWASNMKFQHNSDRTIPSGRFTTGENLFWSNGMAVNPKYTVNEWFKEYKDFTYGPLTTQHFQSNVQIGHYTQVAWAKTLYVGCGVSKNNNEVLVVCNYGPAGNMLGETPYARGPPANKLSCGINDCSKKYGRKC